MRMKKRPVRACVCVCMCVRALTNSGDDHQAHGMPNIREVTPAGLETCLRDTKRREIESHVVCRAALTHLESSVVWRVNEDFQLPPGSVSFAFFMRLVTPPYPTSPCARMRQRACTRAPACVFALVSAHGCTLACNEASKAKCPSVISLYFAWCHRTCTWIQNVSFHNADVTAHWSCMHTLLSYPNRLKRKHTEQWLDKELDKEKR